MKCKTKNTRNKPISLCTINATTRGSYIHHRVHICVITSNSRQHAKSNLHTAKVVFPFPSAGYRSLVLFFICGFSLFVLSSLASSALDLLLSRDFRSNYKGFLVRLVYCWQFYDISFAPIDVSKSNIVFFNFLI